MAGNGGEQHNLFCRKRNVRQYPNRQPIRFLLRGTDRSHALDMLTFDDGAIAHGNRRNRAFAVCDGMFLDRLAACAIDHPKNDPWGCELIEELLEFSFALRVAVCAAKNRLNLLNFHIDRTDIVKCFGQP